MTLDSSAGSGSDPDPGAPPAGPFGTSPVAPLGVPDGTYPPVPPAGERPGHRWGIPAALLGLAIFVVAQVLAGLVVLLVWRASGHTGVPYLGVALASLVASYGAVFGYQVLVARVRGQGVRADYALRFRWPDLPAGIVGGVVAGLGLYGGSVVVAKLTGLELESSVGTVVTDHAHAGPVLYVFLLAVAFGAPFVEELHFRGMWWGALGRRLPVWAVLLLTSALFALAHLEPVRILGLLVAGAVLGGLRWWSGRTGPGMIAHCTLNAFSAVQLLLLVLH